MTNLILGAPTNFIDQEGVVLTAAVADADNTPVEHLGGDPTIPATRFADNFGARWRSPTLEPPDCTIEADLGESQYVGAVALAQARLSRWARHRVLWTTAGINTRTRLPPTTKTSSPNMTIAVSDINDDPVGTDNGLYGYISTGALGQGRFGFGFPPESFRDTGIHYVRLKVSGFSGGAFIQSVAWIKLYQFGVEIAQLLPFISPGGVSGGQWYFPSSQTVRGYNVIYAAFTTDQLTDPSGVNLEVEFRVEGGSGASGIRVEALDLAVELVNVGFNIIHDTGLQYAWPAEQEDVFGYAPLFGNTEGTRTKDILAVDLDAAGLAVNTPTLTVRVEIFDPVNPDGFVEAARLLAGAAHGFDIAGGLELLQEGGGELLRTAGDYALPAAARSRPKIRLQLTPQSKELIVGTLWRYVGDRDWSSPMILAIHPTETDFGLEFHRVAFVRVPSVAHVPNTARKWTGELEVSYAT